MPDLVMWSHDDLDALLAAAIGRDASTDRAVRVTCGDDDSAFSLRVVSPDGGQSVTSREVR